MLSIIINSTDYTHTEKLITSIYDITDANYIEIIVVSDNIPKKSFCDWIDKKYKESDWAITLYLKQYENSPISYKLLSAAKLASGDAIWFMSDDFSFTAFKNIDLSTRLSYNQVVKESTPDGLWSVEIVTASLWPQFVLSRNLLYCLIQWECNDFYWLANKLYNHRKGWLGLSTVKHKQGWFDRKLLTPTMPNCLTYLDTQYYSEFIKKEVIACQKLVKDCVVKELSCASH